MWSWHSGLCFFLLHRIPIATIIAVTRHPYGVEGLLHSRSYDSHDFYALHLDPSTSPESIARRLNGTYEGPIGELLSHHRFSVPIGQDAEVDVLLQTLQTPAALCGWDAHHVSDQCREPDRVLWSQRLLVKSELAKRQRDVLPLKHLNTTTWAEDADAVQAQQQIVSALNITDPLFPQQWHLFNTMQVGQDTNVTGVWREGVTGKGVTVAIIDNGLDTSSQDFHDNLFLPGSWNFNEKWQDPTPKLPSETHGTRCGGEVAGGKNGICGLGMAYDARIAGIRLLGGPIDESDEAAALNYRYQDNDIYVCSWGPPDGGGSMSGPGELLQRAFRNGVENGRGKKGSIYVFAAGNGGFLQDNCNFDGYTNSIYTVTIGAITRLGEYAQYSEPCSALLAVTYSSAGYQSEGLDAISTTDVGAQSCTSAHGGTSAAGPLAAGAVALVLSVRPDLTWRDVQYLLYETAVPINNDAGHSDDWQRTGSGKDFSHRFGFGKIDTYALVQRAREWQRVQPQTRLDLPRRVVEKEVPQNDHGIVEAIDISYSLLQQARLARLEHVTVTINTIHTRRGDLSVELHSPHGVISHLSTTRINDDERAGYKNWTFMSVAHWGESGEGIWRLVVKDTELNEHRGMFVDWSLTLWGEVISHPSNVMAAIGTEGAEHDAATAPTSAALTVLPVSAPKMTDLEAMSGVGVVWLWAGMLALLTSCTAFVIASKCVRASPWHTLPAEDEV